MGKGKIESNILTVSEIAEKAGVSRNKVWSYIRRNKIEAVEKKNKVFKFDSDIISEISKKQEGKQARNNNSNNNSVASESVLSVLKKQLEANQEIIKSQQKQIEKQQETIDYFKSENIALRLDNSKKIKLLEDAQRKKDAVSENNLKQERNKHWWQRLF
ncbi:helix-turn-helix domain-containing protein [Lactobacillus amylovorus]|uniref:helix-turn-helix domain-containing protein n=1 Tax=Lactobacillus amylovorus TaxID=1604 RepID=UPI0022E7C7F3|nr:helix-turn-helix domain-containing protein [Lactobacillus amylovorus]